MNEHPRRSAVPRAIRDRDTGLRKVSILTRVLVVCSVAATGMFSALAAWAQPGRSKTGRSVAARPRAASSGGTPALGTITGSPAATTPQADASAPATTPPAPASPSVTTPPIAASPSPTSNVSLSPPDTLPAPDYSYSGPPVVSGAS